MAAHPLRRLTYADLPNVMTIERRTFGTPWSQLAPGRQAAVIVAAEAAANGLCG